MEALEDLLRDPTNAGVRRVLQQFSLFLVNFKNEGLAFCRGIGRRTIVSRSRHVQSSQANAQL